MKKSVIFVGLLLVLSSIVYSIEISWPGNVPFGNAFHDNLYVNVIASAEGDDIIDINASLDLGEWVISGNGSGLYGLNVDGLTIGDIIIGTDEDGNLEIEGNLIIGDALFVGVINTSIIYTNELHAFNFVRSTQYCNYDGSLCVDLEGLSDTPGLLAVLGVSADASGFTEEIRIGGALNVGNPLTVWDGENYIELNSGGDFYAIQSNQNVRISGPSAGDLTEL
ncbi:hypothetical protein KY313_03115, partial [Candidatus Woesearchaeota archaeon]|nr:hypothetical protein [Candidatus Woesearchaeota archaeon]